MAEMIDLASPAAPNSSESHRNPAEGGVYPPPYSYLPPAENSPYAPVTMQPFPGIGFPPSGTCSPQPKMGHGTAVCPPGLEYLTMIDQILIHQQVELLEVFLGCETKNKYIIKNSLGQQIFTAKEETDCCTRNCLGPLRPFDMLITDNAGNEVIHLYRHFRCDCCCCPCCLQEMEVMAPPGNVIGTVVQEWSILHHLFSIKNAAGEIVLQVKRAVCKCSCCGDIDFKVLSKDGETEVGCIRKQWSGITRELFTDADHFGITFPMNLDVTMKALLLGACMLIDFMFFEENQK